MRKINKWLATLLAVLLVAGCLPLSALAEGEETPAPVVETQEETPAASTEPVEPADGENLLPVEAETYAAEDNSLDVVYVSADGDDDTGEGTEENPVATLAKAVSVAKSGATIYVMSDLTMTESARFWNKNLTITSYGDETFTVTRGDFTQGSAHDSARAWYNPAMIEVGGTDYELESSLWLENIIFDDAGLTKGTYYVQAESDGDGKSYVGKTVVSNTDIVQDAIIATYNNTATITLGNGTVLKNFGGMSAVRISGGVLIMESGSKIIDDAISDRTKQGSEGDLGPAGAVWVQGGDITIEHGSEISGIRGRALYVDSGTVSISGTISNITGDEHMWWSQDGVAVHVRNGADVTLEEDGIISEIKNDGETGDAGSAAYATSGKFTLDGVIENCYIQYALFLNASQGDNTGIINGIIRNNVSIGSNGYIVVAQNSDMIINSSGIIEKNQSGISTVYAPAGANIDLYGTIQDNVGTQCGGIHMYGNWNGGRNITVDMYDGAKIINNRSSGGSDRGGAVCSGGTGGTSGSTKCIFTMHGGEISGNESTNGAVFVRKNGQAYILGGNISKNKGNGIKVQSDTGLPNSFLIMEDGSVIDNEDYGVYLSAGSQAKIDLNGGTIQGNNNGDTQIYVTGGSAKDENERIFIDEGIVLGNTNVSINNDFTAVTIDKNYSAVQLGTAASSAKDAIKKELSTNSNYTGWKEYGSSPLYVKPSENTFHFTMNRPKAGLSTSGIEPGRGLFVAYVPLQADGTPANDAEVTLQEIVNQETLDITLDHLTANTSYAVMLVVSDEYVLRPDDITIYTGGKGEGFPSWTMENTKPEDGDVKVGDDTSSYNLDNLEELFTVSYYDGEGNLVQDDHTPGMYTARLGLSDAATGLTLEDDGSVTGLTIGSNTVRVAEGTLTIRYVSDEEEASDNELTEAVVSQPPEALGDMAVAVIPGDATYHTNGSNSGLGKATGAIHLMFDDLLPTGTGGSSEDRIQMLIDKAETDGVLSFDGMDYQFKYLDLVDNSNGNAWVSTDQEIIIYWPYPAGTDQETEFTLLHFTGLHREYSLGNEEDLEKQIEASEIKKISVDTTELGIWFTLQGDDENGSFSPFALVWEKATVTPPSPPIDDEPADPDDTGVSDLLETEDHNQYLYGYPDGTFGPGLNMTRAEAAQMFYNLLVDQDVTAKPVFDDVPEGAWYAEPVNVMAKLSIVEGVGDDKFEPNREITRAEFTAMAMRFAQGETGGKNIFSDVDEDDWFYDVVVDSIKYGWIEGYPDGTFRPQNLITREEVTTIVNRMLGRLPDEDYIDAHEDDLDLFPDVTKNWAYYDVVEATNDHQYKKTSFGEDWTKLG